MSTQRRRSATRLGALLLAGSALAYWIGPRFAGGPASERVERAPSGEAQLAAGEADILSAFAHKASGRWIEAGGTVTGLLPDDLRGSRHQRFIVQLPSGHTLLVSHNIDLARRVAGLRTGDRVKFRGEYEWNPRGGVIHWTHRDPSGRRVGGWIEREGRRYR